ncbi:MAG TPA: hypothetical protein VFX16_22775 [Pseudonocardiaceae bacterium]|nr:hypothetical protein [Pseudonocardiaceae bacterium]
MSDVDRNVIWVTEVWQSKEHHEASLRLPETQAAIAAAMPLLTGEFTRQELMIVGGSWRAGGAGGPGAERPPHTSASG